MALGLFDERHLVESLVFTLGSEKPLLLLILPLLLCLKSRPLNNSDPTRWSQTHNDFLFQAHTSTSFIQNIALGFTEVSTSTDRLMHISQQRCPWGDLRRFMCGFLRYSSQGLDPGLLFLTENDLEPITDEPEEK